MDFKVLSKMFSISILYIISLIYTFCLNITLFFKYFFNSLINITIILYNFGEENYIKKSQRSINYPKNIGLILNTNYNSNELLYSLICFIKWSLYSNISHISIYDPFGYFKNEEIAKKLVKYSYANFSKNFSIIITFDGVTCYNCKTKKEVNKKNINSFKYDLSISIIQFKSANEKLINKFIKNDKYFPNEIEPFYNDNFSSRFNKSFNNTYEKFYTRKKANGIPEIIICFGKEELCLYGFPFTLLENCEIKKCDFDITDIGVVDFVQIFDKYAHTNKRFGK